MTQPPPNFPPSQPPVPPPGRDPRQDTFFAVVNGQETGPLQYTDLQNLTRTGQLRSESQVRTAQGGNWFPLGNVPGLFSDKEWLTMVLISWFGGSLGIDRFLLGYTGLGVAKLLTCGGCGVWSIIDLILIIMRKLPDAEGRALAS